MKSITMDKQNQQKPKVVIHEQLETAKVLIELRQESADETQPSSRNNEIISSNENEVNIGYLGATNQGIMIPLDEERLIEINDNSFGSLGPFKKSRRVSINADDIEHGTIPCKSIKPTTRKRKLITVFEHDTVSGLYGLVHPQILAYPGMNSFGFTLPITYKIPILSGQVKDEINQYCRQIVSETRLAQNKTTMDGIQNKVLNLNEVQQKAKTENKRKRVGEKKMQKVCRMHECSSTAAKNTPYCAKHSGTRICEHVGCQKCAQGRTRFCIRHGGGRRCTFSGCNKGARDHRFCAAHGGGRRCNVDNCNKAAVGGTFKCSAHGGGRRCKMENCNKCAQSGTLFCVKHGGGKRCSVDGCLKVSRGKSFLCMSHKSYLVSDSSDADEQN